MHKLIVSSVGEPFFIAQQIEQISKFIKSHSDAKVQIHLTSDISGVKSNDDILILEGELPYLRHLIHKLKIQNIKDDLNECILMRAFGILSFVEPI